MLMMITGFLMPVLLVFGLYHLLSWFNPRDWNSRTFRIRVGLAAAIGHIILVSGFFAFSYLDYNLNRSTTMAGVGFDNYLFNGPEFWRLMTYFDTAPMLALLGFFAILARLGLDPPYLVAWAIVITLVVGTIYWYLLGGVIGLLLERFWSGLKTDDEGDEDWY
jgi:hypothetical protein